MLPHERDFFVSRIKSGYIRVKHNNEVYKFQLNNDVIYESEEIFIETYEDSVNAGIYSEDDIYNFILAKNIWNEAEEERLNKLMPEYIEKVKVEMFQTFHKPSEVDRMRKYVHRVEQEMYKLFETRHQFDYLSCSGAALYARWQFIVQNAVTMMNGDKVDWSKVKSSEILNIINNSMLPEKTIRGLARNEPWGTIWAMSERGGQLFSCPISEYTEDQKRLIGWSMMYDNIRKYEDAPAPEVFHDDECFDGWMILKNKKNKVDSDREKFEKRLGKNANAQEIFVPVKCLNSPDLNNEAVTLADPEMVFSLNSPIARSIIDSRCKVVDNLKPGESVKVNDLPDVRTNLMMQANRMSNGKG